MSELDLFINKILLEHKDKIIDLVIGQILEDVMDLVLHEAYKQHPELPIIKNHRELLDRVILRLRPKQVEPNDDDYEDHKWKN